MKTKRLLPAVAALGSLFTTVVSAFAQTWTQTSAPLTNWSSIASSADGTKLVAGVNGGGIYTSVDSGGTWTMTSAPSNLWRSVASSADGTNLVAGAGQSAYTSVDAGGTWALTSASFGSVASSSDGKRLVAANQNQIYTSTNGGETWAPATNAPSYLEWTSVASSADGSKLIAGGNYLHLGEVWRSADSGATWTESLCCRPYSPSITSSADGNTLIACGEFGVVTISTNSGATWTTTEFVAAAVASSADGTKLVAGSNISTDSGGNWTPNGPPGFLISVASSADGNTLAAVAYESGIHSIYVSQSSPAPFLNVRLSDTNLTLSWTVPSLSFALQEKSDLTMTNWMDVTNTPTLNLTNLQNRVLLSPPDNTRFYRLKH